MNSPVGLINLHVVDVDQFHIKQVRAAKHERVERQRVDDLGHADLRATVRQNQRSSQPVAFVLTRGRHSRLYHATTNYHRLQKL